MKIEISYYTVPDYDNLVMGFPSKKSGGISSLIISFDPESQLPKTEEFKKLEQAVIELFEKGKTVV